MFISHVSLYNNFVITSSKNGSSLNTYNLQRNINIIPLINSKNYKIINFNVSSNFDGLTYDTNNIILKTNLRFYLDDNPVINRLNDTGIFTDYVWNGVTNNTDLSFSTPYISDSSNQFTIATPKRYYNYLEQYNSVPIANQFMDLTAQKTFTVIEQPLKNIFFDYTGTTKDFSISQSVIKDFYFNSYNYDYLVICIFPFINIPSSLSSGFSYESDYVINFDLIQEDL